MVIERMKDDAPSTDDVSDEILGPQTLERGVEKVYILELGQIQYYQY